MNYKDLFKPVSTEGLFEAVLEKHKQPILEAIRKAKEEDKE